MKEKCPCCEGFPEEVVQLYIIYFLRSLHISAYNARKNKVGILILASHSVGTYATYLAVTFSSCLVTYWAKVHSNVTHTWSTDSNIRVPK